MDSLCVYANQLERTRNAHLYSLVVLFWSCLHEKEGHLVEDKMCR